MSLRRRIETVAATNRLAAGTAAAQQPAGVETVASPAGRTVLSVTTVDGGLHYRVDRDGHVLVQPSRLGFRYVLPEQPELGEFGIEDELIELALADNARAW